MQFFVFRHCNFCILEPITDLLYRIKLCTGIGTEMRPEVTNNEGFPCQWQHLKSSAKLRNEYQRSGLPFSLPAMPNDSKCLCVCLSLLSGARLVWHQNPPLALFLLVDFLDNSSSVKSLRREKTSNVEKKKTMKSPSHSGLIDERIF